MSAVQTPTDLFDDEEDIAPEQAANGAGSDDDDGVQAAQRRRKAAPAAGEDEEDGGDDLFGDEDEDVAGSAGKTARRQLDDEELDSGDDEGRADRIQEDQNEEFEAREIVAMDMEVSRQPVPEPSDGEMYLMKIPPFMSIEPQAWQTTAFQPPTTDHHSKKPPTPSFSAYNTAMTTIRWRHSPSNPAELQSNARINRWSDGSLTIQLASDPTTQYEVDGNPLAPPQRNPLKPTPTSITGAQAAGKHTAQDAYTYLIVPVEQAEALRVAQKVTAGLTVKQTNSGEDEAIEKLQAALALAANATKVGGASGTLEVTDVDPELQRKKAEVAERQALRERKKREHAQERDRVRTDRALGRSGLSSGRFGGLNVGMLEDDEMEGGGRSQPSKGRKQQRRRRNSEYSEDEDMGRKRFTKEDSYDQEDDFVAASDEEEEVVSDDDPDDGIVEQARERTPKRDRARPAPAAAAEDEDEDAEGEPDDDVPQARVKRRRVVDDDEDE